MWINQIIYEKRKIRKYLESDIEAEKVLEFRYRLTNEWFIKYYLDYLRNIKKINIIDKNDPYVDIHWQTMVWDKLINIFVKCNNLNKIVNVKEVRDFIVHTNKKDIKSKKIFISSSWFSDESKQYSKESWISLLTFKKLIVLNNEFPLSIFINSIKGDIEKYMYLNIVDEELFKVDISFIWSIKRFFNKISTKKNDNLIKKSEKNITELLRSLRSNIAKQNSVDPVLIFDNDILQSIILRQPKTKKDLLKIPWFTNYQIDKYWDKILKTIND